MTNDSTRGGREMKGTEPQGAERFSLNAGRSDEKGTPGIASSNVLSKKSTEGKTTVKPGKGVEVPARLAVTTCSGNTKG